MKIDQDRHDLTWIQVSRSSPLFEAALQQFAFPRWSEALPKVIDMAV
jgi:hypothetical protein